jgi:hypothetical protein
VRLPFQTVLRHGSPKHGEVNSSIFTKGSDATKGRCSGVVAIYEIVDPLFLG